MVLIMICDQKYHKGKGHPKSFWRSLLLKIGYF